MKGGSCGSCLTMLLGVVLWGCDKAPAPPGPAPNAGAPKMSLTAEKPVERQAVEAMLASPETAMRLANSSPEATALAAAREAERVAADARASPESSLLKVEAYAKLAAAAAAAAPGSASAKGAAERAEQQRAFVQGIVDSAKTR